VENSFVLDGNVPVYITEQDLLGGQKGDLVLCQVYPTWVLGRGPVFFTRLIPDRSRNIIGWKSIENITESSKGS
jgi:hypothetical protein